MLTLRESMIPLELDSLCTLTNLQNRFALFQDWVDFMTGEKSGVAQAGFFIAGY